MVSMHIRKKNPLSEVMTSKTTGFAPFSPLRPLPYTRYHHGCCYRSRPNLSSSSSTSSYAGLNPWLSLSPSDCLLRRGLGCVSFVPPNDVYPWS